MTLASAAVTAEEGEHDPRRDPRGDRGRDRVWQAVAVGAMALLLVVLRWTHPWIYFSNDKRNQYLPVMQDIGRRLRSGDFPAVDPDLGPGGNYALDVQYGLYDPLHWLVGYGLSFVDDQYLAGWLMSLPFLLAMVWGTAALVQRLGCHGAWSAAAGLGAGTSGYVFFSLAPYWWPGAVGMAFLPWLWHAWLARPGVLRLLAVAAFTYLVIASGWPSAWLAYAMLAGGLAVEATVRRRQLPPGAATSLVAGALASTAGALAAATNVVPLLRASEWTSRRQGISNTYYNIPNWADVGSFSVPFLRGDLSSHNGKPTLDDPIFFFGWFIVVLAWLTLWRRDVWRQAGVVTAAAALAVALLATQFPSDLGPIRIPSRQLAAVQFFAVVFAVLGWRASPAALTVRRASGALLTFGAMAVVAWSRTPTETEVFLAIGAGLIAVAVLLALWSRAGHGAAGIWVLVATPVLTFLAMTLENSDPVARHDFSRSELSVGADEQPGFALFPHRGARPEWLREGIGIGFSGLAEDNRYAPGYSSVSQRQFRARFYVQTPSGKTDMEAVRQLFKEEATTGEQWVDLLGYKSVLVPLPRARALERAAGEGWAPAVTSESFVKYSRTPSNALAGPGRVTAVQGDVALRAVSVQGERQEYEVLAPDGGRLVFRDLYWPGYIATLDGDRVPVTPFKQMLVSVDLPPGAQGTLVVRFRAQSPKTLTATLGGGAVLLAGSVLLSLSRQGRAGFRRPRARHAFGNRTRQWMRR